MIVTMIGQYFLVLIFSVSAISKSLDINEFKISMRQFVSINRDRLIDIASSLIILAEFSSSFLLIFFYDRLITLVLTMGLMVLFIAALLSVSFRKQTVYCNCFGKSHKPTNKSYAIVRNMLIMALIFFIWSYQIEQQFSIAEKVAIYTVLTSFSFYIVLFKHYWYEKRGGSHA